MEQNKDKRAYVLGTVVLGAGSLGLAERVYREYQKHSGIEPTVHDIETVRTSAMLMDKPITWNEVYFRAQQRAQGQHTLEMGVLVIGALACFYGAYRCLRRAFR
ncbi:MAG: hypothetical protein Q7R76_04235 [Candidatus Woesearchaeota archaeon]|nr:hypothetical protein [Candidatus Woesearchaeota archaeon]